MMRARQTFHSLNRMNNDICQIKLELDVFEISGPNEKVRVI